MQYVYTRLLSDEELRPHLERGDSVVFKETAKDWQLIEHQIEQLGFGDDYAVSRTWRRGLTGGEDLTRVNPVRGRSEG